MMLRVVLVAMVHLVCIRAVCDKEALQLLEWVGGPFVWADSSSKSLHQNLGLYIKKNVIATRAQIHGEHVYLALPRYKPGVPATLARVNVRAGCNAILEPYPCWSSQQEGNCQALQNVVDLYKDDRDVLWVLDIGVVNTLTSPVRKCAPKVLAFSLLTGKVLKSLDLSGLVVEASRLQYVVVEYDHKGRPYVYVSDAATRSILVFDVAANRSYRVVLPRVITHGCNRRDVLYIALSRRACGNNYLIFTYLCSNRVFSIRTDHLRSGSAAGRIIDLGPKPQKIVIIGTDGGAAIFFRYDGQPQIYRWDSTQCFKKENFLVVYQPDQCFLATSVFPDVLRQRVRVLQSNFPDFIHNTVGCGAVQRVDVVAGDC